MKAFLYQLSTTPLIKGMGKLLETILQKGFCVHLLCMDAKDKKELDALLWTYSPISFLPHATDEDKFPELQPILLSCDSKNQNNAKVLLCNYTIPENISTYERFVSIHSSENFDELQKQVALLNNLKLDYSIFKESSEGWQQLNNPN